MVLLFSKGECGGKGLATKTCYDQLALTRLSKCPSLNYHKKDLQGMYSFNKHFWNQVHKHPEEELQP